MLGPAGRGGLRRRVSKARGTMKVLGLSQAITGSRHRSLCSSLGLPSSVRSFLNLPPRSPPAEQMRCAPLANP
jgi:hypothetical protein